MEPVPVVEKRDSTEKLIDVPENGKSDDTSSEYSYVEEGRRESIVITESSLSPPQSRKRKSDSLNKQRLSGQISSNEEETENGSISRGNSDIKPRKRRSGQFSPKGKVPSRTRSKPIVVEHKKNLLGEVIYKGHQSWVLMQDIQLAIRYAVGRSSHLYGEQDLQKLRIHLHKDFFKSPPITLFPTEGSDITPAHKNPPFKFKDYMPLVFRHLREKFKIDPSEYMNSLSNTLENGENSLIEVPTPGKSGSLFFYSSDLYYILKTIPKREAKLLRELLPDYYNHVMINGDTLLPKFFGLHRIKPKAGRQVRFVVMANIFATHKKIHEKYDLKGSRLGREISDAEKIRLGENVTYKDLDWNKHGKKLNLGTEKKKLFLQQLKKDCELLERLAVMDYSLLVGIHSVKKGVEEEKQEKQIEEWERQEMEKPKKSQKKVKLVSEDDQTDSDSTLSKSDKKPRKKRKSQDVRTPEKPKDEKEESTNKADLEMGLKIANHLARPPPEILALSSPLLASPDITDPRARHQSMVQTTFPLPPEFQSKRISAFQTDDGGMLSISRSEYYFVGIIDILMLYTLRKRAEHSYKMIIYGAKAEDVSSINPHDYAERFLKAVSDVTE